MDAKASAEAAAKPAASETSDPPSKQWSEQEVDLLYRAVRLHGENWAAVAEQVGTRSGAQCEAMAQKEASKGDLIFSSSKVQFRKWSDQELARLRNSFNKHGRNWVAISLEVRTRDNVECRKKAAYEIRYGRLVEPKIQPTPRFRTTGGPKGAPRIPPQLARKEYEFVRPSRTRPSRPTTTLTNLATGIQMVIREPRTGAPLRLGTGAAPTPSSSPATRRPGPSSQGRPLSPKPASQVAQAWSSSSAAGETGDSAARAAAGPAGLPSSKRRRSDVDVNVDNDTQRPVQQSRATANDEVAEVLLGLRAR